MKMNVNVAALIENLSSDTPKTKYAAAKRLVELSETSPQLVYPYYGQIKEFLDGDNQILQWTAIRIIGHLAVVDRKNKTDGVFMKVMAFLNSGKLIAASTAAAALVEIGAHKPRYMDEVLGEIINVEKYTYKTPECRNVVIGNVLKAIAPFGTEALRRPAVHAFVVRQRSNPRASVRRLAEKLT